MDIIGDNHNQDKEVGFDVLNGNQNLIIYPELKFKRKDLFFINTNKLLIDKINKKENLLDKDQIQEKVIVLSKVLVNFILTKNHIIYIQERLYVSILIL